MTDGRAATPTSGASGAGGAPSLAEWVAGREPASPLELRAHLDGDLLNVPMPHGAPGAVCEALVETCERALGRVLRSEVASRETALDLLSADAYVTYAFEAAADDPATLVARADDAMRRVSALAASRSSAAPRSPGGQGGAGR